jgi:hypothetical protein
MNWLEYTWLTIKIGCHKKILMRQKNRLYKKYRASTEKGANVLAMQRTNALAPETIGYKMKFNRVVKELKVLDPLGDHKFLA